MQVVLVVIFSVLSLMVMIVMERDMKRIELGGPTLPPSQHLDAKQIQESQQDCKKAPDDGDAEYSSAVIVQNE